MTQGDFVNYELSDPPNECDLPASPFSVGDYPRIHQLANGLAVGVRENGYVLDFDWCPLAADNERFLPLADFGPQPQQNSNTTVHYVDLRGDDGSGLFVAEWIVSIAGADKEAGCDPINPPAQTFAESAEGVFMKNPAPGGAWTSLPSLNKSRTEANAVVGLNGEIVVFGGYGHDAAGNVVARMKPELLRPIFEEGFLFGPALASAAWLGQCEMTDPHTYHSVGCLLPDGRMLVGGGNYPCDDPPEQQGLDAGAQSFEIFSPPGLFGGPRPRIDSVSATELAYSTNPLNPLTFSIEVLLQGEGTGEFRVALTRPASVTHAFDNNQRYVVLQVNDEDTNIDPAPAISTISVFNPTESQRNAVPPGYYLLTVVNEWGRPAAAKWIRMVP